MRLDLYLYQNGYAKSRQKAKSLIEEGNVKIDGCIASKPSQELDASREYEIEITDSCPYVSRGGLKLEKILELAKINVENKTCLDIGASTGGFTHCLLLKGAKRVYAVDSGTGQFADELKNDSRVISMENYNARNLSVEDIGEAVDIITIDVSFISQKLIMPSACKVLKDGGVYLSLIKPQFEVGRALVGKGGIVKDKKARLTAALSVIECARICGLACTAFAKSPIQGGDGNTEYVAAFSKCGDVVNDEYIKKIVFE